MDADGKLLERPVERAWRSSSRAGRLGRVVDAPVQRHASAREHRAGGSRPVADGDHVVEALAEELADGLGAGAADVDPDLRRAP